MGNGTEPIVAVSSAATATITTGVSAGSATEGDTGLFTRLGVPSPSGGEDNGNRGKLDSYQSYSPHHQQQHQPHHHSQHPQSGYMTVAGGPGTSDTPPLSSANMLPVTSVEAITTTSSQTHMAHQVQERGYFCVQNSYVAQLLLSTFCKHSLIIILLAILQTLDFGRTFLLHQWSLLEYPFV